MRSIHLCLILVLPWTGCSKDSGTSSPCPPCGEGMICNLATGQCVAGQTARPCTPPCSAGTVCDQTTGYCVPDSSTKPEPCGPNTVQVGAACQCSPGFSDCNADLGHGGGDGCECTGACSGTVCGGAPPGCAATVPHSCSSKSLFCDASGACVACPAGTFNCDGLDGCESQQPCDASSCTNPSWKAVGVPPPDALTQVWGSSASNVYATGSAGILHFDGVQWFNSGATSTYLFGIWGSGVGYIFAVGESGKILHFDGSGGWKEQPSGVTVQLNDVWGSGTTVFAVGDAGTILRYDGSSWTPLTSGTSEDLYAVWGSSASDVYAAGDNGTLLRYTGSAWQPIPLGLTGFIEGIWGSGPNDVFVVGDDGRVVHYDGSGWTAMTSGTTRFLFDIWGSGPNDVFAVGDQGTVIHYDGSAWTEMTTNNTDILTGVWGAGPNDVFAVGTSFILRYSCN